MRTDFDLALGWSNRTGLHFRGSAGLEATLPLKASLLGLITVDSVYLALRAEEPAIEAVLATTASVNLGPFTAGIERVGLRAEFTFPETGGNLGPANVELDFKPPNGVGLAIDSGVIVGGGFLFFDPENEQYAGILQLEFGETISLNAIGLLTTRLPDGRPGGFSLLVDHLRGGFSPIQLGLRLHPERRRRAARRQPDDDGRHAAGAASRTGPSARSSSRDDPIRNAPADHQRPQTRCSRRRRTVTLFGPMAIIGWGTPTLLTLEIALLLELPEPVRLILLGRLRAVLPGRGAALVRVRMDAIGRHGLRSGRDLARRLPLRLAHPGMFALTGDMALRAELGERPNFVAGASAASTRASPPARLPARCRASR